MHVGEAANNTYKKRHIVNEQLASGRLELDCVLQKVQDVTS